MSGVKGDPQTAMSYLAAPETRRVFMEDQLRIYITGASCAGVTTLGQNLASQLGVRHADVDDFFWMPTDPPFTTKRPVSERVPLIQQALGEDGWVLTGSCMVWGDVLLAQADLTVFVVTPTPVRLERLAAREKARFGDRIAPGGDMHEIHVAFREWASQYDDPNFSGRNRAWHERWLSAQTSAVVKIDGVNSTETMAAEVIQALPHASRKEATFMQSPLSPITERLNNRRFTVANNASGLSGAGTVFHYQVEGDAIFSTYQGGRIRSGTQIGRVTGPDSIELLFQCLTTEGEMLAGWSRGSVGVDHLGRTTLSFVWGWLSGATGGGESSYIEFAQEPV